jgi:hypothetical protein
MNTRNLLIILALTAVSLPGRADFNDGVIAYQLGEYDKAYTTMRSLADTANHAYAQYWVGMMFLQGQGVEQDYAEAGVWFRKASEQSIPQAQYKLGTLYMQGQGLPRDFEQAYAWFKVAAAHNHALATQALNDTRSKLTAEELAEAEKAAGQLVKAFGPKSDTEQPKEIKPD